MNTIIRTAFIRNCVYVMLILAVIFLIPCSQLMPGSENGKNAANTSPRSGTEVGNPKDFAKGGPLPAARTAGDAVNTSSFSGTETGNPVDSCKVAINDDPIMDFMKLLP